MNLTKKQTEEELSKFLTKQNGLNEVSAMLLNAIILGKQTDYLNKSSNNKGNGYRLVNVFGYGNQIELRIPRDSQSAVKSTILPLFSEQKSYLKEVSFEHFSKGLITRDISNVSKNFYEKMEI